MPKKILYILGIVVIILSAGVAGGYFSSFFQKDRVIVPNIKPAAPGAQPIISTHVFPFEQSLITISIPINRSVYEGARSADKSVTIFGNISENVWVAESYRAMAGDPNQEELYRSLITEFRKVKGEMGLTDDEYLELMAAYVQSLRYETGTENPAKFPIETVVEASGDCDDKSLLLAGLLSHEDYNVALFSFGPEAHMAVGVGSDEYQYKNTDYTFIETTNFSFVGVPTRTLENGVILQSSPLVIPMGAGSNKYHLGGETQYIEEINLLSEKKAKELELQVRDMESDLKSRWDIVKQLEEQMMTIKASGNTGGYNARVAEHNALVLEYNTRLEKYRELRTQYEQYANIYNYIISHEYDRKGVYTFIKANVLS
ncbi:hypothetical protein [uncultured Methanoregula sp.]|uniref:hypothetical protein n=1 Tax=uncultured Methanoregula sp. TaxID=1005933 RepID=UPI002AAA7546|nr:hypothetical protein [uncultured Methanoregula sp.]